MDASELGPSNVDAFQVTMVDGGRHRYVRTDVETDEGLVYDSAGHV